MSLCHASAMAYWDEVHGLVPSGLQESTLNLFQGRKGPGQIPAKTKRETHMGYNHALIVILSSKGNQNLFHVRLNI